MVHHVAGPKSARRFLAAVFRPPVRRVAVVRDQRASQPELCQMPSFAPCLARAER